MNSSVVQFDYYEALIESLNDSVKFSANNSVFSFFRALLLMDKLCFHSLNFKRFYFANVMNIYSSS